MIAHPVDEPDVIIGYMVFEPPEENPLVHFIYVKKPFREMGVANTLIKGTEIGNAVFTHWTNEMHWITRKYPGLVFDPYLA